MEGEPHKVEQNGKGKPLQILEFEFFQTPEGKRRSRLILNKENLDGILKKTQDKSIALISIVGPSRQGKSFLLGFLIRYLESLNTEETDWFGYETPNKALEGFNWRSGVEPETMGTWMWSDPFFVKIGDGKECAVLLMDTQGTYDEYTTQREWSSIVGMSLLTSSCLIFNFFNNLQEDTLSSLGSFIEYGLMTRGEGEEAGNGTAEAEIKPFQKLLFLIRDWNSPSDFPYGSKGGRDFLKRKLEIKPDQGEEARRIRESIHQCFEEITCFLMPEPGEKLKNKDYDGSIQGLNPKFSKNLEAFVTDLLNPDELNVKHIGGSATKGSELALFFEKYVEVLNSEETLQPLSLLEATTSIRITNIGAEALEAYKKGMQSNLRKQHFFSDKEIFKCHEKLAEKALLQFNNAKKPGNPTIAQEFREKLGEDLEREFQEIKKRNLDKKFKKIQEAQAGAVSLYIKNMKEELGESFLDPKPLKVTSDSYREEASTLFSEECSNEDPELLPGILSKLVEILLREEENFLTANAKRMQDAENAIREIITRAVELYTSGMNDVIEQAPGKYLSAQALESLNARCLEGARTMYNSAEKEGDAAFLKKYEAELKTLLTTAFSILENENMSRKEVVELRTAEWLHDMIRNYETKMDIVVANAKSEEELKTGHDACASEISVAFLINQELPREVLESQLSTLFQRLEAGLADYQLQFAKNSRNLDMECDKARTDALALFNAEISTILDSKEYHRTDDFQTEYEALKQDVIDDAYGVISVIGVPAEQEDRCLEKLRADLETSFGKFKEQNILKQEHAESKAQNDISDSVRSYQEEVRKGMENCRTEGDLADLHDATKISTVRSFKSKYVNVHPDFLDPFIVNLESEIERNFVDLGEVFLLKREEAEAGTKSALVDAQKFYREEMEKHFKNESDFMSPDALARIHSKVTQIAIDRCNAKLGQTLSSIQKADLKAGMETVYLKYTELNEMNMPTNPAIGIDLGTTYCCVGVYHKGKVTIIENNGKKTTPSYVSFTDTCEVVGEAAKNEAHENPENTIYDAKRIIGRKFNDAKLQEDMKMWPFVVVEENGVPKVEARGKTYHPEEIAAKLLKDMKRAAEDHLGVPVTNAVITVPAYFSDGQRQATIDAGELAGLKVLKILDEPTAAAIAYRLQHVDLGDRNVLIFDLGGGTFDVAVLRIRQGVIEVKTKDGDTHLGGEDYDNALVDHCVLEFQSQHGIKLTEGRDSTSAHERQEVYRLLRRLKSQCEDRKVDLSSSKKVTITVDAIKSGMDLSVPVTREKFENMNAASFARTIEIVERALKSAGVDKGAIHDIVLVGGSTRIPMVQQLLSQFFNGKALNKTINPDEAVAYGAAIQAAIMNGEIAKDSIDFTKIQDVIPMSLGIEVYGGDFSTIIRKNTNIPIRLTETYRTAHNNQTAVHIKVYQGEQQPAKSNEQLGEFVLNGVPPAAAGKENINVTMEINQQGILHVSAVCCSTNGSKDLAITEYKQRMSRGQIQKILADQA